MSGGTALVTGPNAIDASRVAAALDAGKRSEAGEARGAAVLIPLIVTDEGLQVLFEVRAAHLAWQPGEVCLPGGHREPGEPPLDAALREAREELLVDASQVRVIGDLGEMTGPRGLQLGVFVGILDGYRGTFDPQEVGSTFTVPLAYFLEHDALVYRTQMRMDVPEDLPWDVIPGGRAYPWRPLAHEIPFYLDIEPVIWGFTARVMRRFVGLLQRGDAGLAAVSSEAAVE